MASDRRHCSEATLQLLGEPFDVAEVFLLNLLMDLCCDLRQEQVQEPKLKVVRGTALNQGLAKLGGVLADRAAVLVMHQLVCDELSNWLNILEEVRAECLSYGADYLHSVDLSLEGVSVHLDLLLPLDTLDLKQQGLNRVTLVRILVIDVGDRCV